MLLEFELSYHNVAVGLISHHVMWIPFLLLCIVCPSFFVASESA